MRLLGTVTEAAEVLDVDAATVWELVAVGELDARRDNDAGPWAIWAIS